MGAVADDSAVRAGVAKLGTLFDGGAVVKIELDNDGAPPGIDTDDNGGGVTENELNNEDTV